MRSTGGAAYGLRICPGEGADIHEVAQLSSRLGVPVGTAGAPGYDELFLVVDSRGVALSNGTMQVRGDFTRLLPRLRNGALQRELLVRAAKVKGAAGVLTAVDATAGLGDDSLLLAAAGFEVHLYERNPVIAVLLEDTLRRAAVNPALAEYASRMHVHAQDSVLALACLGFRPDVVFLDPMFPEKRHAAASRKKLQLLQALESPCDDGELLLAAARSSHPRKIVVKRPLKGPYLGDVKPGYSLAGKTVRYDVTNLPG